MSAAPDTAGDRPAECGVATAATQNVRAQKPALSSPIELQISTTAPEEVSPPSSIPTSSIKSMNTTMMCKVEQTRNKKEQVKKNIQKAFSPDKHADDEWGGPHFGEGVKFLSQLLHWVRQQLVMVTVIVGGTVVFTVAGMKGVDCPFSATVAEMEKDWHSAKGVGSFEDYMRQQLPSENVAQGLTLVFTDPTNRLFHCEAPWDFLDGLYFTMTTISTVGYGDLSPDYENIWIVLFTIVYVIVGLIVAFPTLAASTRSLTRPLFAYFRDRLERMFPQRAIDIDGNGEPDFKVPRHPIIYYSKGLVGPLLVLTVVQLSFAGIFAHVEGFDFGVAFYQCMITATTVGYGSPAIVTNAGKVTAIFHIFVSVTILASTLSEFDHLRENRRLQQKRARQFLGRLNVENILSLDVDGGGIDRFEFVVGMLTRLEYVSAADVQGFVAQFDALDQSGDGIITKTELEEYARAQQAFANDPARCAEVAQMQKAQMKRKSESMDPDAKGKSEQSSGRSVSGRTGWRSSRSSPDSPNRPPPRKSVVQALRAVQLPVDINADGTQHVAAEFGQERDQFELDEVPVETVQLGVHGAAYGQGQKRGSSFLRWAREPSSSWA